MEEISGRRSLHRLVYASRQRVAAADLDHEVGRIIQASIRNNRAVSITGLLLVHEDYFLQSLEGPAEAVMATYRRILDDPRHQNAMVLSAGPVPNRAFGDWNMCARRVGAADDAILKTLARRGPFDPTEFSPPAALRLLKSVRHIQGAREPAAMISAPPA